MSDIKLPELPKPWDLQHDEDGRPQVLYTADQLREYAKQAAELERERCIAAVVAAGPQDGPLKLITDGFVQAIRGAK